MKKIISLALCLALMMLAASQPVFAAENQYINITFTCQYISGYNVAQSTVDGEVRDNYLYVKPEVIAELCGMYAVDAGKNIILRTSNEDEWIFGAYQLDVDAGTLTDIYTMSTGQKATWNIPTYKADDGTAMVSFEHMLKALNVEVLFDPNSTVPISVYRPYSVIELSRKVSSYGHNLFFNWNEIDPNASFEDSKTLYLLSSLNSLLLDYNDHFITDALYSWWTDDIPTANEAQFQDAIYEIMTCYSDIDTTNLDTSVYETFKLQNDVFGLTDDMMSLIGVEDEAISILGLSSDIGEYGTIIKDRINTYIQYKNISETQSEMLDTTFLSSRDNSIFREDGYIQIIRKAAQQLQDRISSKGVAEVSAICDAVVNLSAKTVETGISRVTPVFIMIDMATTMVKILPGTSQLVEINEAVNRATHCDLVGTFAIAELYRISESMRSLPVTQTAELLNEYKQVLVFSLQASYAVRDSLIDTDLLDDATVSKLRDKNSQLLEYLAVIQNSSPKCPPKQVECSINWNNVVEKVLNYVPDEETSEMKGTFNQSDLPASAVEFNGHFYYVYNLDTVSTWNEAKQYCENQGGYLATITSPEENEFVYSYLKNNFGYESAYFGFTDQDEEGIWVWNNGEVSSYTNWHSGEPNGENPNEDFAMFYYKYSDGTWNDGDFGKRTVNSGVVFICEWGEYIVGTTSPSENYYETDSAFGKYLAAAAKTTEIGSWSEQLTLEADMSIAYEGGRTKTKVTLTADSDVSNYVEDDLSQIEI